MKIRIHTQDGLAETFFQDNALVTDRILKGIQPSRVFANIITIAGEYSMTTFVASHVSRVDFVTDDVPPCKFPPTILDVVELPEDEFRQRSHLDHPSRLERRLSAKETGELTTVCVEVELTGGKKTFLAAEFEMAMAAERLNRLHLLFSAPALYFRLREGGFALLNLKNLIRFTFHPGPDVTPTDAWPAHHLSRSRRPLRSYEPVNPDIYSLDLQ